MTVFVHPVFKNTQNIPGQAFLINFVAARQDKGPLDSIFKIPDIPGPRIGAQVDKN